MSFPETLRVGIHFELICPWCFIGKHQFERAREDFARQFPAVAVATNWHPVQLLPGLPEQGLPFKEFYEQRLGSAQAVRRRQQQVLQAAKRAGLELDFSVIRRMPNTRHAHALLRQVAVTEEPERYEALLERLYSAHFQRGEDIGDLATLRSLAIETGISAEAFAQGTTAVAAATTAAVAIAGVPYYDFGEGISLSGAHEPEVLLTAMKLAMDAITQPNLQELGT